jgi:hypothetical protein
MAWQILLLVLLILVSLFAFLFYMRFLDEQSYNLYLQGKLNPYKRKQYFLTAPERELFLLLQKCINSDQHLIFPQLHLSTLLVVKDETADLQGKFDWLNRLFVDFVIFKKDSIEPALVIELNDSTHFWNNRKARDQFVKKALEDNGIKLLTIETNQLNDKAKLEAVIKNALI